MDMNGKKKFLILGLLPAVALVFFSTTFGAARSVY